MPLFGENELSDMMGGVRSLLDNPSLDRLAQRAQQGPGLGQFAQQQIAPAWDPLVGLGSSGVWQNAAQGGPNMLDQSLNMLSIHRAPLVYAAEKEKQDKDDANKGGGIIGWVTDQFGKPQPVYSTPQGNSGGSDFGGGPSDGLDPGVAQWASQTKATFGDISGLDPDTMLAIMTNESGGDPNVQNHQGAPAYGLFQLWNQPGLTPEQQFQAAHQLAQQKMAGINAAYAKNGLNPDARQRQIDFMLAWAGHFDYDTGRANPESRDQSGQTAAQLTNVFVNNYDKIKNGRQRTQTAPQQQGAGLSNITPGVNGTIMQEFGPTDYSASHPDTYAYGNAYGLQGSQHPGIDWAVPAGTKVATPLGGTVTYAGGTGYYTDTMHGVDPAHSGEYMVTLDNGDQLILGHMSQINVRAGQRVNAGDLVGLSGGSDGDHVHVEYRQRQADGSYRIIDPRTVLGRGGQQGGQQPTQQDVAAVNGALTP